MKITFQNSERMELRGTPHGRSILFGIVVTLGLVGIGLLFGAVLWQTARSSWVLTHGPHRGRE